MLSVYASALCAHSTGAVPLITPATNQAYRPNFPQPNNEDAARKANASGSSARFFVTGSVTEHDARVIRQRVLDALLEGQRAIVFDLAQAQSFDSGALGILVSITRRVAEAQGTTEFENVTEQTRLLFAMMRLDHLFVIRDPRRVRSRQTPSSSSVIPNHPRREAK